MSQTGRSAPDPEWVQMYRSGIPAPKIAAVVGAAETTVRYHLAIASRQDPGLRAEHRSALSKPPRVTAPGQRNLDELDPAKEKQLNETIPGWRQGRQRRSRTEG